ncbi:MAG: hypothetical protein L3J30_08050 [Marinosulfonomonas sp.]|nr:hypothetical protein [Marinosulfonomonas sp.]
MSAVSGCAAEVSQRIAEAVFAVLVEVLPDCVLVRTPGGGGYGGAAKQDTKLIEGDMRPGRYSVADAARLTWILC